jgi:hypothetical protein
MHPLCSVVIQHHDRLLLVGGLVAFVKYREFPKLRTIGLFLGFVKLSRVGGRWELLARNVYIFLLYAHKDFPPKGPLCAELFIRIAAREKRASDACRDRSGHS